MVPYWTVWRRSVLRDVLLSFGKDLFHLISLLKLNSKSDAVKTVAAQSHFSPVYIYIFFEHQSILYHIQYKCVSQPSLDSFFIVAKRFGLPEFI